MSVVIPFPKAENSLWMLKRCIQIFWLALIENKIGMIDIFFYKTVVAYCVPSWRFQTYKSAPIFHKVISMGRPFCLLSLHLTVSSTVLSIYWALWSITVCSSYFAARGKVWERPSYEVSRTWQKNHLHPSLLESW